MEADKSLVQLPQALNVSAPEHWLEGDLTYYPHAISDISAQQLYRTLLNEINWQQVLIQVFGKQHLIPRLQSWIGDPGTSYQYSGRLFQPEPWTLVTQHLCTLLNSTFGTQFNSVLANYYRSGNDKMGWHSDDEIELGKDPVIASLSFGSVRDFALRKQGESRQHRVLALSSGSVLIMNKGMQSRWQHALPARKKSSCGRVNLTFRQIISQIK